MRILGIALALGLCGAMGARAQESGGTFTQDDLFLYLDILHRIAIECRSNFSYCKTLSKRGKTEALARQASKLADIIDRAVRAEGGKKDQFLAMNKTVKRVAFLVLCTGKAPVAIDKFIKALETRKADANALLQALRGTSLEQLTEEEKKEKLEQIIADLSSELEQKKDELDTLKSTLEIEKVNLKKLEAELKRVEGDKKIEKEYVEMVRTSLKKQRALLVKLSKQQKELVKSIQELESSLAMAREGGIPEGVMVEQGKGEKGEFEAANQQLKAVLSRIDHDLESLKALQAKTKEDLEAEMGNLPTEDVRLIKEYIRDILSDMMNAAGIL